MVLDIPKICTIRFLFWAEFKRILFELFCIREIDVYFRKFQITFSKECTHIQKQQTVKYNNVILFKSFKAFVLLAYLFLISIFNESFGFWHKRLCMNNNAVNNKLLITLNQCAVLVRIPQTPRGYS